MKSISILFFTALSIITTHIFGKDKQDEIIATWETQKAPVEIYKVDDRYIGNPINSEGERNTEIEVLNLEYEKGKWVGKIYFPKSGRIVDVSCHVDGDKLLLEVRAGLITRDFRWQRSSYHHL